MTIFSANSSFLSVKKCLKTNLKQIFYKRRFLTSLGAFNVKRIVKKKTNSYLATMIKKKSEDPGPHLQSVYDEDPGPTRVLPGSSNFFVYFFQKTSKKRDKV